MRKEMKNILCLLISLILFSTCDNQFEETNLNPNKPAQATPSLVFNGIIMDVFYTGNHSRSMSDILTYSQYMVCADDFYGSNSYNWGTANMYFYGTLANTVQLEREGQRMNNDAYQVLAKTFKAYLFFELTRSVGDIPCSEALRSEEGIYTPKYDTQKEVLLQCLEWLEEANEEYKTVQTTIEKELIYDGDLSKWHKFNNGLRLRILIALSNHADDSDLNVKNRFAEIVNNPAAHPIFTGFEENAEFTYYENMENKYPFYMERDEPRAQIFYMTETFLNPMVETKDPRVFVIAEPTDSAKHSGNPDYALDFNSYEGIRYGIPTIDVYAIVHNNDINKQRVSRMHVRYESYTGEPYIVLGYPEVNFCIAEGINRGWVNGDAADYYRKGITGSMQFYGIAGEQIEEFLVQPEITYAGNNETGLRQILTQKYTAFFNNSRWEGFYTYRRTGIPDFTTGPGSFNDGKVPMRWTYPREEYDNNDENLEAALARQFNGSDDRNDLMWLLRK